MGVLPKTLWKKFLDYDEKNRVKLALKWEKRESIKTSENNSKYMERCRPGIQASTKSERGIERVDS
ncbi:MAG: hypothetical protein KAW88_02960 [Candidatus Cloacimonetes bacterium]|nr:hypothetical protein [Candidatus Cloacimonadota bacterium]